MRTLFHIDDCECFYNAASFIGLLDVSLAANRCETKHYLGLSWRCNNWRHLIYDVTMSIFEDFESSYSCCGRQLCFISPTCKEDEVKKENPQKFGISIYTILLYHLFQNRVDNLTNGVKLFAKNYSDWSAMTLNDILSRFHNLLEQEFRKAQSKLFSGRLDDIASFLIHSFCLFFSN